MSLTPAVIELVVSDMTATLAFYRRLGLEVPEGAEDEPHVDVAFGGTRLAFDTTAVIRSFDDSWTRPLVGTGWRWPSRRRRPRRWTRRTPR